MSWKRAEPQPTWADVNGRLLHAEEPVTVKVAQELLAELSTWSQPVQIMVTQLPNGEWDMIARTLGTTYEEWRVTGTDEYGTRIGDVLFTPAEDGDNCEAQAKSMARWARSKGWTDGPHLHRRTVTVSEWTEVDT